jgi:hypothetical protein
MKNSCFQDAPNVNNKPEKLRHDPAIRDRPLGLAIERAIKVSEGH